jgi:dethiobiotin synthetase
MTNGNPTIAILGIHTGIGKTITSAVMTEALGAHYWKPVQAGLEERDTDTVSRLITNGPARVHHEAVQLKMPASPHTAAAAEGITIDHTTFVFPRTTSPLLVETAGGVLSPISHRATMADFVAHFQLPAILVSQNYLGSINHTLAAIEVIRYRGIPLLGVVMNGTSDLSSESFIESYTGVPIIARVPHFHNVTREDVVTCALAIRPALQAVVASLAH